MKSFSKSLGCSPRGALVVVGGVLIHLSLGSFYTFGNFAPYIISYLRNRTDETSLRNVDAIWVNSVGSVLTGVGMTCGGLLDKAFGPRIATTIGAAIFVSSVALTYFTIKKSFVWLIVSYGATCLMGNLMAYGPPVQTSMKWFPEHPALATGLIVAGFGGGALIFNQVITGYINPDNLKPDLITPDGDRYFTDPELLDRVPYCFLILAGCFVTMEIIGILMITRPPSKHHLDVSVTVNSSQTSNGTIETPQTFDKTKTEINQQDDVVAKPNGTLSDPKDAIAEYTAKETIKKMFRTRAFYIVWLSVFLGDIGLQFVFSLYKAYGQTFILDDKFLALVGSLSSVCNCIGRPLWGIFIDKFGYRVSMGIITVTITALIATLFTTEYTGKAGFMVWICLIFLAFSGITAILPTTLAKLFGASNMAVSYGFLEAALAVAGIVSGVFATTLKSEIGFRGLFFLSAALFGLQLIGLFFWNGKDRNGKTI